MWDYNSYLGTEKLIKHLFVSTVRTVSSVYIYICVDWFMLVLHIIKQKLFSSGIHYKSAGRMSLFNSLYFDTYANVTVQCFRISVSFYFSKLFMCDINTHLHRWMSTLPECLSNWCLIIQISHSFSPTTKTLVTAESEKFTAAIFVQLNLVWLR